VTMLSIFTASTRPSVFTGSPVNGSSNWVGRCTVGVGEGDGVGVGRGGGAACGLIGAAEPASAAISATATTTAAAPPLAIIHGCDASRRTLRLIAGTAPRLLGMSKGYVGISAESDQNRYIERTLVPPGFDTTTADGGEDAPSLARLEVDEFSAIDGATNGRRLASPP
jgi:hypothetical protein